MVATFTQEPNVMKATEGGNDNNNDGPVAKKRKIKSEESQEQLAGGEI